MLFAQPSSSLSCSFFCRRNDLGPGAIELFGKHLHGPWLAGASGFDHDTGFALATWLPLTHRLNVVVEPYGYTSLNPSSPAFASATAGFNYKVRPRLYIDSGLDVGVTAGAPRKRVFIGITYAVANAHSWMRSQL